MDRPPEGFEMIARMPEQAVQRDGAPYRSGPAATPRLPWVTLRWRAHSVPAAAPGLILACVSFGVVGAIVAVRTSVVAGLLALVAAVLSGAPRSSRMSMRLTVTDRFVSGGRDGLFGSGVRLPLRAIRDVLLLAPGDNLREERVCGTWWLALRDRDGTCHPLTMVDDEPSARWLLRGVRALIAERTAPRRPGPSEHPGERGRGDAA